MFSAKHAKFKNTQKIRNTICEHTCANCSCQNGRFSAFFHFGGFRNSKFLSDRFDRNSENNKIPKQQKQQKQQQENKMQTQIIILLFKTKQENKQKQKTS